MTRKQLRFEALVQQARGESLPPIDVADRVVRSLVACVQPRAIDWPWWWAIGLSVTAAAVVLIVATQQGVWFDDPLAHWLRPLVLVMQ
jgi:hypothetical protein